MLHTLLAQWAKKSQSLGDKFSSPGDIYATKFLNDTDFIIRLLYEYSY